MPFPYVVTVDPRDLKLPTSRMNGADHFKLTRQYSRFGISITGMPMPLVVISPDGVLQLLDGVTRATRVAKWLPGTKIEVEVIGTASKAIRKLPAIGDRLP